MRWWLALLLLWMDGAQSQSASAIELDAKRYLRACINAVAIAVIDSGQTTAFNGKPCADPAFNLAQFLDGETTASAVASSRIEFGTGGLEDFKIQVTDRRGVVWTGSRNDSPRLLPRPASQTPEQRARVQEAADRAAAHNILRRCFNAIEQYRVDHGGMLNPAWDGQSCQDTGLIKSINGPAIARSLITLEPETLEGYQITVWPVTGEPVTLHDLLTPGPTRLEQAIRSGELLSWLIGTVVGAALLYGFVFKFPSRTWAGSVGLLAAGLAAGILALFLFGSDLPAVEWGWVVITFPLMVLGGSLLFAVPRLMYWFGREKWWVSLGLGTLAALFSVFVLGYLNTALPASTSTSSPSFFGAFYGLPILSMLLTLALLWRRLRQPKAIS